MSKPNLNREVDLSYNTMGEVLHFLVGGNTPSFSKTNYQRINNTVLLVSNHFLLKTNNVGFLHKGLMRKSNKLEVEVMGWALTAH